MSGHLERPSEAERNVSCVPAKPNGQFERPSEAELPRGARCQLKRPEGWTSILGCPVSAQKVRRLDEHTQI